MKEVIIMAKRGRPPKSLSETSKHLTKEEIEKKKKAEEKIKKSLKVSKVKAPDILRKEGEKLFKELSKDLMKLGLFTQLDVYNLALYVNLIIEYKELQEDIKRFGTVSAYEDVKGNTYFVTNPAIKLQKDCIKEMKSIGSMIGLSVGDRLKYIQMINNDNEEEKEDKFDKTLKESNSIEVAPISEELLDKLNNIDNIEI